MSLGLNSIEIVSPLIVPINGTKLLSAPSFSPSTSSANVYRPLTLFPLCLMSTQKTLCSFFLLGRLFHSQVPLAAFCAKTGKVKAITHPSKSGILFFIVSSSKNKKGDCVMKDLLSLARHSLTPQIRFNTNSFRISVTITWVCAGWVRTQGD